MNSVLGNLAIPDFVKAALMAGIGAAIGILYGVVQGDGDIFSTVVLLTAAKAAGLAALTYLLKNLGTNSLGQFAKKEPTQ